eukprot:6716629-Heterocapsa_arctica.AAC.1
MRSSRTSMLRSWSSMGLRSSRTGPRRNLSSSRRRAWARRSRIAQWVPAQAAAAAACQFPWQVQPQPLQAQSAAAAAAWQFPWQMQSQSPGRPHIL